MIAAFDRAFEQCEQHDDLRAVVLRGAGRAFCAGADLKYLKEAVGGDQRGMATFLERLLALFARIERFPLPVIAAVNGLALARGLEMVLVLRPRDRRRVDAAGRCPRQLWPAARRRRI